MHNAIATNTNKLQTTRPNNKNTPEAISQCRFRARLTASQIISEIRKIDAESIIIAGTTTWSQDIHLAADDQVAEPYNVMYAFHFYAC